jgi:hypothetical protein
MSVTVADLQAFADAWNRHDAYELMSFMTDDCVFEASAGPDVCGMSYLGREAVRDGFADVWKTYPDAQWRTAATLFVATAGCPNGPSPERGRTAPASRSMDAMSSLSGTERSR